MNKIKIIELLNMISRGEEVPKKIRYKGDYWYLEQKYTNRLPYYSNGYDKDNFFTGEEEDYFSHSLNDEVEIIEEDKKIDIIRTFYDDILEEHIAETKISETNLKETYGSSFQKLIIDKINEIIDNINKGDK